MCWTRTDMLEADQGRGDCSDPSGDVGLLGLETLTPEGRGQAEDLQSAKQSIASVQPCPSEMASDRANAALQVSQCVYCRDQPSWGTAGMGHMVSGYQGIGVTHFFLPWGSPVICFACLLCHKVWFLYVAWKSLPFPVYSTNQLDLFPHLSAGDSLSSVS